jgi:hypothetical protein
VARRSQDPDRHDNTWVQLRAYQLARQEHEDPGSLGIPLDSPERQELNEVVRREGLKPRGLWTCQPRDAAEARRWAEDDGSGVPGPLDRGLYHVFMTGDLEEGARCIAEARRRGALNGDIGTELFAVAVLIRLANGYGRHDDADRLIAEGADLFERVPPLSNAAMQYLGATAFASTLGDVDVTSALDGLNAGARSADQSWAAASLTAGSTLMAAHQGDRAAARAGVDALLPAITRAIGGAANYPFITCCVSFAQFLVGDDGHADLLAENLVDKVIDPEFHYLEANPESAMGCLDHLRGDLTGARQWWQRSTSRLTDERMATGLVIAAGYEAIGEFRAGDEQRFVAALERIMHHDRGRPGLTEYPALDREIAALRAAGF